MQKFNTTVRRITLAGLSLALISATVLWYIGTKSPAATICEIGLGIGLFLLFISATCLQVAVDNSHDTLSRQIARAEAALLAKPDLNYQASALIEDARECLRNAEQAPVVNVHAGPEIDYLRQGHSKAQEALALLI
jgi:hypothetical protein